MIQWFTTLVALVEDLVSFPHPHNVSQSIHDLTVVRYPGDLMLSSDLCRYQSYKWYTDTHAGKTLIHLQ